MSFPLVSRSSSRMIDASSQRVGTVAFRSLRFITSDLTPSPTTSCTLPHLIRLSQPSAVHDERRQSRIQVPYEAFGTRCSSRCQQIHRSNPWSKFGTYLHEMTFYEGSALIMRRLSPILRPEPTPWRILSECSEICKAFA